MKIEVREHHGIRWYDISYKGIHVWDANARLGVLRLIAALYL